MYKVSISEAETFPKETMHLWYEVDFDGDNLEYRKCVEDILVRLRKNHEILEVDVPDYLEGEDFVELKYSIDGVPLELSCDFLLESIYITTNDKALTESLRQKLGSQVGWAP